MFNFRGLFSNPILDNIKEQGYPNAPEPLAEPEREYYSIGPTTEGRVMLKLYYGNVSMDETGLNSLIGALEAAKAWCEVKVKVEENNE